MEKVENKMGFKAKLENIWFYHKWHILVGALVILFLSIATVQCATSDTPDITILYIGDLDIGDDRYDIKDRFGDSIKDVNDDGKTYISLTFMGTADSLTPNRFQTEVVVGDHIIYIASPEYFEKLVTKGVLAPLKEVLGYLPDNAVDGYGVALRYLDIAETDGFDDMTRNSILCIRGNDGGGIDYEGGSKYYRNNVDLFRALFAYKDSAEHTTVKLGYIGDQTMLEAGINKLEYSIYGISRAENQDYVPLLEFEQYQLKNYNGDVRMFTDEDKAAAEAMAAENGLLLLDKEVYEYLRDNGLLISLKDLGIRLTEDKEEYGLKLANLDIKEAQGFSAIYDSMYLCGGIGTEGYTAEVLKYLRDCKKEG